MFSFLLSPVVLAVIAIIAAIVLLSGVFAKNYVKVPPNMVAVFTGRGKQKIVRGGARFRVPVLERVDFMSLEPFNVEAKVNNVYSKDGVPVSVDSVALIRFGSTDEMIATAVERFLTSDRQSLHKQVTEILSGNMRGIVSQMTIEELNSNREELTRRVTDEAAAAFAPIGMQLDVLTVQNISDANGYLEALGTKRISEVKRDAKIGAAEADRDSIIKSAQAQQEGQIAQAAAETAIAQANADRDKQLALLKAAVSAEQARSNQAGPLAEAEAKMAVGVANEQAEAARVEANTEVERRRSEQAQQRLQADVVAPAEADKAASIAHAEAEAATQVAQARAAAEARTLQGTAEAEVRVKQGEADANARKALADAALAEALAEAQGQEALAEALNKLTEEAARQRVLPQLIEQMPVIAGAVASAIAKIDRISVIDGGSGSDGDGDTITRLVGILPAVISSVTQTLQIGTGIDVSKLTQMIEAKVAESSE